MSWGTSALWAAAIGLLLLACGTGAQAWANLTEYRDLWDSVGPAARQAVRANISEDAVLDVLAKGLGGGDPVSMARELLALLRQAGRALLQIPRNMTMIRQAGGEDAARIAMLARMTVIWTVLMFGSLFILAGAGIQLALAYTGP
jgi:hypothetical protein